MLIEIIILTILVELLSIALRAIFGPMKDRHKKIKFKYKIRIHHGYIGVLLLIAYLFYPLDWIFIVGISLTIADAIHHFIFLKILTNETEFP